MEYIHSKDIFRLMRDTLKMADRRVMDHGFRVAYYLYKMLECSGGYEEFELADMICLATLHDIGAYKTNNTKDLVGYEYKDPMPHATYGYLIFKHLSPLPEYAQAVLYHHTNFSKLQEVKCEHKEVAELLHYAEKVDIFSRAMKDSFDMSMLSKQVGTVLSPKANQLFAEVLEEADVLNKVKSGEYVAELENIIEYMIFTNEDKKKFLEMLMFCQGFRSDIGMLAIPKEIIEAPRKLTAEEYGKVKTHVHLAERVLTDHMAADVVNLIAGHHERCDGSGYPRGLRGTQMSRDQEILQLADTITALLGSRAYRTPMPEKDIVALIRAEAAGGKYNKTAANVFLQNYDEIMKKVTIRKDEILVTYRKLNQQYKQVSGKFKE